MKIKITAWIGQLNQVKKFEGNFSELVRSFLQYKTLGTPNFGTMQQKVDDPRISEKEQGTY
jgi:hypothetical protein